jgi:ComEC/Rec2-related protein
VALIFISAMALVGLALGDLLRLDVTALLAAAFLAGTGTGLAWRKPAWRILALATCATALGAARASTAAADGPSPPALLSSLATPIGDLHAALESGVRRFLPEPQASLAVGVLLGGSAGLDAAMRLELQHSGLAHLVAIDGLKQVLIASTLGGVSVRLVGPSLATLPTLVGVAGYTLLTGGHPSAIRAGLMVGLATLASLTGRMADPLTSLLLTVVAMATAQPRVLLDIGLQLSFAATLGIVLLWPCVRRRLCHLPRLVAEPVGLTLAVTLATLPVALSTFQVVSLISPVAHIIALPLLSAVLVTTIVLGVVSSVAPLALAAAWVAWVPTTLLVGVVRFFGSWPAAAVSTGKLAPLATVCLAAALLVWGLWGLPESRSIRLACERCRAALPTWSTPAVCVAVLLTAGCALTLVRPDGQLHVERVALARGEAVFIRGPTGRTALVVNGRADPPAVVQQVADHLAAWEHKLDALVQLGRGSDATVRRIMARYPADQRFDLSAAEGHVDLGGGAVLDVSGTEGRVSLSYGRATSDPTTSAAKPGSGD